MNRAMVIIPRTGDGTDKSPYSNPLTCGWQDETGQPVEDIITGKMSYSVQITCTDAELASIKAQYPVIWEQTITEDGEGEKVLNKATLETAMKNTYATDIVDYCTADKVDPDEIAEKIIECQKRPPWKAGLKVKIDDVYAYGNNLYRCVQAHTTQSDWTPDKTPALWVRFHEVEEGPQPWEQPAGAHDAYRLGVKVTYKGHLWENTSDYNVYAPGVWGWKDLGVYP